MKLLRPSRILLRVTLLAAVAGLTLPGGSDAQTVTDRLTTLAEENARLYLQPVSSGLGAGLNAGFFETAGSGDGVHVRVGLQASGSLVPEGGTTFEPVLPGQITFRDRTFEDPYAIEGDRATTPTALGEGDGAVLDPSGDFRSALIQAGEDPEQYRVPFPAGVDLPGVPMALAEASVTLPTGTAVMGRFLPELEISSKVGALRSYGGAVRQSLTAFIDRPPLDVGVAAGIQKLTLGDVVEATGRSASLIVSRDLDLITLFASGGVEESTVDVSYTVENPGSNPGQPADGTTIDFEAEGENETRFTGGIRLDLFVARLSISYTRSEYDVLQTRLSFGS